MTQLHASASAHFQNGRIVVKREPTHATERIDLHKILQRLLKNTAFSPAIPQNDGLRYNTPMSQVNLCVIYNPIAGRRRAAHRLDALRRLVPPEAVFWPTERAEHAVDLARQAAESGFGIVAAAGGDGTVHEVANGLLQAARPDVVFAVVPLGSANDYAASLDHEFAGEAPLVSQVREIDVGVVRDERGRERFFVCCLGLGLNGIISLEARKIQRLRGLALYGLATLRALRRHCQTHDLALQFDDGPAVTRPNLMLSALIGRREGRFVMAPHARLGDGLLDFVCTGSMSRWEVLRFLPGLAMRGPPTGHPAVELGRCRRITVRSDRPLVVHTDGEIFSRPEDDVHALEIAVVHNRLRVLYPLEPGR
ncbi:MAG: hypothetical protein EXS05_21705 [Planctomycetaceae bacterium]|nr:hypothetical protein [Planctomycetaceae bacterium]